MDSKYLHFAVRGGGGLIHKTKLPMQELELKVQGGLAQGGCNCGILRYKETSDTTSSLKSLQLDFTNVM